MYDVRELRTVWRNLFHPVECDIWCTVYFVISSVLHMSDNPDAHHWCHSLGCPSTLLLIVWFHLHWFLEPFSAEYQFQQIHLMGNIFFRCALMVFLFVMQLRALQGEHKMSPSMKSKDDTYIYISLVCCPTRWALEHESSIHTSSLSLFLSVYIYIYMYTYTRATHIRYLELHENERKHVKIWLKTSCQPYDIIHSSIHRSITAKLTANGRKVIPIS